MKALFLSSLVIGVLLAGCRRDMFDQPKSRPLRESSFFPDGTGSRSTPPHVIARGHLNIDEPFATGRMGTNLVEVLPIPTTRELLERGRERFDIYCSACHGRTGEGNGMIVQRGFPAPPSFKVDRLRAAPVGHFFDVMTRGYGVMYSQASRVEPADRWAIAAYIRALQLSLHAGLTDAPLAKQAELQKVQNEP
jgi:mono/diheme cytochrome c family protein